MTLYVVASSTIAKKLYCTTPLMGQINYFFKGVPIDMETITLIPIDDIYEAQELRKIKQYN
jgi:hypothetical protein